MAVNTMNNINANALECSDATELMTGIVVLYVNIVKHNHNTTIALAKIDAKLELTLKLIQLKLKNQLQAIDYMHDTINLLLKNANISKRDKLAFMGHILKKLILIYNAPILR